MGQDANGAEGLLCARGGAVRLWPDALGPCGGALVHVYSWDAPCVVKS